MALQNVDDATLLLCCDLFIAARGDENKSIESVAKQLNKATRRRFSRVDVYRMVAMARERDFFKVLPRADRDLEKQIAEKFDLRGSIVHAVHVVPALQPSASEAVSSFAAEHALDLIKEIGRQKQGPVGVGFVGGNTIMRVARLLSMRMRADSDLPAAVSFHSICSGFDPRHPETAPLTFLGYFTDLPTDVSYGAFFAPPAVTSSEFKNIRDNPIVERSRELGDEIDIVLTSLASFDDEHNILRDLAHITGDDPEKLKRLGVLGDVAYEPFGESGPLDIDFGYRAVTLFSIPDLVARAKQKGKEVLLVAGPCPGCGTSRERSLEPVLRVPALRVWSHAYLDSKTAQKMLRGHPRVDDQNKALA